MKPGAKPTHPLELLGLARRDLVVACFEPLQECRDQIVGCHSLEAWIQPVRQRRVGHGWQQLDDPNRRVLNCSRSDTVQACTNALAPEYTGAAA